YAGSVILGALALISILVLLGEELRVPGFIKKIGMSRTSGTEADLDLGTVKFDDLMENEEDEEEIETFSAEDLEDDETEEIEPPARSHKKKKSDDEEEFTLEAGMPMISETY